MKSNSLSKTKNPPEQSWSLGKKSVAITVAVLLVLSTFSFTAFAEETNSQGSTQDPLSGSEVIVVDDQAVVEDVSSNSAVVVSQRSYTFAPLAYSPMAAGDLNVIITKRGSTMTLTWADVPGTDRYVIERAYSIDWVTGAYSLLTTQATAGYVDPFVPAPPNVDEFGLVYRVTAYAADDSVIDQSKFSIFLEPEAFLGLEANPTGPDSIHLEWLEGDEAHSYEIYRSTSPDGAYTKLDTVTDLEYVNTGVTPDVGYYYRVVAVGEFGQVVGESPAVEAMTHHPIPTNVVAEATGPSTIEVTWDAIDNVLGYYVHRSDTPDGTYVVQDFVMGSTYSDSGLEEGTDYYYKIQAYTPAGLGPLSDYGHAKTLVEAPGKTQNVKADALGTSEIKVSWDANAKAASYNVYVGTSPSSITELVGNTTSTEIIDAGLNPDTTYYYRVEAVNEAGAGELSDVASAKTASGVPDVPTGIKATALSSNSIMVSWNPVSSDDDFYGYILYRSTSPNGTYTPIEYLDALSYEDTGLEANTTYYYKVAASNAAGSSAMSTYAFATTHPVVLMPGVPATISATALSSSSIQVNWSAAANASGYQIYRSTSAGGTYTYVGTSATTSFTNTGLASNTTYYYKVAAYNNNGTSALSNYASAKTHAVILTPGVPATISATALSSSSIQVSWSASANATGYQIYRSTSAYGTYSYVGSSATTYFTNTGLASNTTYYYKVAAYNNNATSALSNYASAKTHAVILKPGVPATISATALSSSSIQVKWSASASATGYQIYRSTSAYGTYSYVGSSATTYFTNTGLAANTTYYYKVAAYNANGTSALSNYAYAKTHAAAVVPSGPAAPPFWLKANGAYNINTYSPQINFAIYPGTMNQNYRIAIYRATSPNGPYTKLYTYTPNWPTANKTYSYGLVYNDNSLFTKGTKLYYKVASIDINGKEGPMSNYLYWTAGYTESQQPGKGSAPAGLGVIK